MRSLYILPVASRPRDHHAAKNLVVLGIGKDLDVLNLIFGLPEVESITNDVRSLKRNHLQAAISSQKILIRRTVRHFEI